MLDTLAPGFESPVTQSQHVFHQAMSALANPGQIFGLGNVLHQAPAPLSLEAAALILALADFETPAWLDAPLRQSPSVAQFLRFHTGSSVTDRQDKAAFAVVSAPQSLDGGLAAFAKGTDEYPDRSTTLIIQCDRIEATAGYALSGPGIEGVRHVYFAPQVPDFLQAWAANHALFPCGVDVILVAAGQILALPRSTKINDSAFTDKPSKDKPSKDEPCT